MWERYERYRERLDDEARYGFHAVRAQALRMLEAGEVHRRYAAVVADETQDLTETSVRLPAALAGGGPRPTVTFVGDGQQSIYPGGFSLRSLGIDVRGRSFVLRTNWRNTYAIWMAAPAFIAGDAFDDLDDTLSQQEAAGRAARAAFVAMTRARDSLDVVVGGPPAHASLRPPGRSSA